MHGMENMCRQQSQPISHVSWKPVRFASDISYAVLQTNEPGLHNGSTGTDPPLDQFDSNLSRLAVMQIINQDWFKTYSLIKIKHSRFLPT